jgi:hypothetical protein
MQNPINMSPITTFIQQVRSAENSRSPEVKMSLQQARMLSLALAECMDKLNRDYETMFNDLKRSQDTEVISVTMDGGSFSESK